MSAVAGLPKKGGEIEARSGPTVAKLSAHELGLAREVKAHGELGGARAVRHAGAQAAQQGQRGGGSMG